MPLGIRDGMTVPQSNNHQHTPAAEEKSAKSVELMGAYSGASTINPASLGGGRDFGRLANSAWCVERAVLHTGPQ
jgi:hypothetical protein